MKFIFAILVIFTALSAYAADYTAGTKCPTAVNHQPLENLRYEAGKSASGYGVAPADEMPNALTVDDFQQVGLAIDLPVSDFIAADRINLNTQEAHLNVGQITTNAKTGEVAFNGRDISSSEPTLANPDCW